MTLTKRFTPFEHLPEKATIPTPSKLSDDQQAKYNTVLEFFEKLEELPVEFEKKNKFSTKTSPITDAEKAWLTKECFLRYLRASKWNTAHCIKRIENTLVWRRSFGVDMESSLAPEVVEKENETGKQLILGYDNDARPCLYLITGNQNTKASHTQVQHLVFMLERVIDYMPPGQDQLALLIDFKSKKNGVQLPPMSIGREVLSILQDHYPERLGKALLTNIPWLGWTFLKLISPFIDPLTREKLVFQEPISQYVPPCQLCSEFGGEVDFEYKHDVYWPALIKSAEERRQIYKANFKRLGSKIGLSEFDLRSPVPPSSPNDSEESIAQTLTEEKDITERVKSIQIEDNSNLITS